MLLSTLLTRYGMTFSLENDPTIHTITADSRHVQPNSIFVAQRGLRHNGEEFIPLAIMSGAVVIISQRKDNTQAPHYHAEGDHKVLVIPLDHPAHFLSQAAAWLFAPLPEHIVAVTGTNGKSSTVDFLRQFWELRGKTAASIGTLGVIAPSHTPPIPSMTTPDAVTLATTLSTLHRHGVTHVALEASSHGLHQHRLDGLPIKAAGFSNLTRDHLDYHASLEAYRNAKTFLFQQLLPHKAIAVINADMDPLTRDVLHHTAQEKQHILRDIGEHGSTLRILNVRPIHQGQLLHLSLNGHALPEIMLPFPGRFQVDNALMAAALCWKDDHDAIEVLSLLPKLRSVPGRCERIATLKNNASVYIDYAHTPDALEHVLFSLRPHTTGAIHIIFGAGGNRDTGKRPLMGQIASHLADRITITDDNPRLEDPAVIRAAIRATCPQAQEIGDRRTAIADGLHQLKEGDILLIAGKGHETGQIIGHKTHPFDDRLVTRSLVEAMPS